MKLNGWFLTLVSASFLTFMGWVGNTVLIHGERLARLETHLASQGAWFQTLDRKLDRVLKDGKRPMLPALHETQPGGYSHVPLADVLR